MDEDFKKQMNLYFNLEATDIYELVVAEEIQNCLDSTAVVHWGDGPMKDTDYYLLGQFSPTKQGKKPTVYVAKTSLVERIKLLGSTPKQKQQDAVIELLWDSLKRDPEHKDRRKTGYGTKTKEGLIACLAHIFIEEESL